MKRSNKRPNKRSATRLQSPRKPGRSRRLTKSAHGDPSVPTLGVHGQDVFFRPSRAHYVRKEKRPRGCVFCSSLRKQKDPEALVVYSDPVAMVVVNKFPYNSGHLLVLPVQHVADLTELTDVQLEQVTKLVRESVRILKKVYQPMGLNVGLNLGAAAGAGIPGHLHFHVIPRWNGDTNFFPVIARTKVVIETPRITLSRLKREFGKLQRSPR